MRIYDCRTKNLHNPLGIGMEQITFSWKIQSDNKNTMQAKYEIMCFDKSHKEVWNSGEICSDHSCYIPYEGNQLQEISRYSWIVRVTDNYGNVAESDEAFFETGLGENEKKACWIETDLPSVTKEEQPSVLRAFFPKKDTRKPEDKLTPATYFRREFTVDRKPIRGRIYVSAHGFYLSYLNGNRIGDRYITPEFTAYHKNILYQTYDVTEHIHVGENVVGAIISDGWWAGRISMAGVSCFFGNKHGLWLQLLLEYEDGTREWLYSDEKFTYGTGAIMYSDPFIGEMYDANKYPKGWNTPAYSGKWEQAHRVEYDLDSLHPQENPPVRVIKKWKPKEIIHTPKGETVIDVGQNINGFISMHIHQKKGDIITCQHGEILDAEGNYFHNIFGNNKEHLDTYICDGEDTNHAPLFAYHGFRYVKITGYDHPTVDDFEVNVMSSDNEDIGTFRCSDARINQLEHNIYWSQLGNFVSVPTDCPQRERGGYTGDLQIYIGTAVFHQDAKNFIQKWLRDLRYEQRTDGSVQDKIPMDSELQHHHDGLGNTKGIAGWGDASVIVPYKLYLATGDTDILQESYASMKKWTTYIIQTAAKKNPWKVKVSGKYLLDKTYRDATKYLWNTGMHYGDWLLPSCSSNGNVLDVFKAVFKTQRIFASGYMGNTVAIMMHSAEKLGQKEDAQYYKECLENIKKAFAMEYFNKQGLLKCDMQGAYAMALGFDLVPKEYKEKCIMRLIELINANDGRMDTGFLSVGLIMDALSNNGYVKNAYDLLYQDKCPSWLYEVNNGATTMWESWNAIDEKGNGTGVSYNHYAFGCVGDWMYRNIGGLEALSPGYKEFLVHPKLDPRITSAETSYQSPYGEIRVTWAKEEDKICYEIVAPPNTNGTLQSMHGAVEKFGSGEWRFEYQL